MLLAITNIGTGDFVLQDPLGLVTFSVTVGPGDTVSSTVSTDLLYRLKPLLDAASAFVTYVSSDTEADALGSNVHRVRLASAGAPITMTGAQTVDAVLCSVGDRILAKDQGDAKLNGIWVAKAGAWVRAADMDATSEVAADAMVLVSEGGTLADTAWVLTTNAPITLGSTNLTFSQLTQAVADSSITLAKMQNRAANTVIGSIAGGAPEEISCTAFGRALIDDASVAAQRTTLGLATPVLGTPTFVVGAPAGNIITVTVTLKDINGTALAACAHARVWLSDTGGTPFAAPSAVGPSVGTSVTTGLQIAVITAKTVLDVVSTAAGVFAIAVEEGGAKDYYLNVAVGAVVASSGVLAFT